MSIFQTTFFGKSQKYNHRFFVKNQNFYQIVRTKCAIFSHFSLFYDMSLSKKQKF